MSTSLLERPYVRTAAPAETVLRISGLNLGIAGVPIVKNVSLSLDTGKTLCLVGESGCGKSLTCLATAGLLQPAIHATGAVMLDGQNLIGRDDRSLSRIRGRTVAMITQDPMAALNPVMTVGAQIAEAMTLHGMGQAAALAEAKRLLGRVGIADPAARLRSHPHELSGGMAQRVAIAMALACRPRLLIADEPTTALDVTIQAQILDLLRDAQRELGMALLLVTHDLGVVAEMADDVAVMYAGHVVEHASASRLFAHPAHPYTAALLACRPRTDVAFRPTPIAGVVPQPHAMPQGCAFAPRCARDDASCRVQPALRDHADRHGVACHHPIAA